MGFFDDCTSGWDEDIQDEFTVGEFMSDEEAEDFNDYLLNNNNFDMPWDNKDDFMSDEEVEDFNNYLLNNNDFDMPSDNKDNSSDYLIDVNEEYFNGMSYDDFQTEEMELEKEIRNCSNSSSISVLKSNLKSFRSAYYRSTIPF